MQSNEISLRGLPWRLASDSMLPRGRRAWEWSLQPTQEGDPQRRRTVRWPISGPIGQSREGDEGELGVDWSEIEHRFKDVLYPPPERKTVTLSSNPTNQTFDPDSTNLSTSWTATGAASHHAATDDYDSPNYTDYAETATEDATLVLGVPTVTDPGTDEGWVIKGIFASPAANTGTLKYRLSLHEGTTLLGQSGDISIKQNDVTILNDWAFSTRSFGALTNTNPSTGANRGWFVIVSTDSNSDTVNQLTALTFGGQSFTQYAEYVNTGGTGERRITVWRMLNTPIAAISGTTIVATWTTGSAPDSYRVSAACFTGVNQTTPIRDADSDEYSTTTLTGLTVVAGDYIVLGAVNGRSTAGESWSTPSGYFQEFDIFDATGGGYHTLFTKVATVSATEAPVFDFTLNYEERGIGMGFVIAAASGADSLQGTTWAVGASIVATISDFTDLAIGVTVTNSNGGEDFYAVAAQLIVPGVNVQDVNAIHEDRGQIFVARGQELLQISPGPMTEVESVDLGALITTMVIWRGKGYVGFGTSQDVSVRNTVTAPGSGSGGYASITNVKAVKFGVGAGKLWVAEENYLYEFGVNAIASTSDLGPSPPFQIHDPGNVPTGIYTNGPLMLAAHERGVHSFTEVGGSQSLLSGHQQFPSLNNGLAGATLDRWTYIGTELGLWAISPTELIANAVGPGEGGLAAAFEGEVFGFPTAAVTFRGDLIVGYYDIENDRSWLLRGVFVTGQTAEAGVLDWYVMRKLDGVHIGALAISTERDDPTLIIGEGANVSYLPLGHRARWVADIHYTWEGDSVQRYHYLTTLMRDPDMLKTVRYAGVQLTNVNSANYWTLALQMDDDGSYSQIGSSLTETGFQYVRPATDGVPDSNVSGRFIKPRIGVVCADPDNPPIMRGKLTLVYDERPDHSEVHKVMLLLGQLDRPADDELSELRSFLDPGDTPNPIPVILPGETVTKYMLPAKVETVTDAKGDAVQVAELTFHIWDAV